MWWPVTRSFLRGRWLFSMAGFFITGTDTDVGKTWSSVALMKMLRARGYSVAGMKPVAAGCEWLDGRWRNRDALLLQQNASLAPAYELVNPYAFVDPVSPHLACGDVVVDIGVIRSTFDVLSAGADYVVVEGAGGWLSPLSRQYDNAALAAVFELPVIMVVGMRLGCINHARLTFDAIKRSGLTRAGWIAVRIDSAMAEFEGNLEYLRQVIDAPLLGVLPHQSRPDFDGLAEQLDLKIDNKLI